MGRRAPIGCAACFVLGALLGGALLAYIAAYRESTAVLRVSATEGLRFEGRLHTDFYEQREQSPGQTDPVNNREWLAKRVEGVLGAEPEEYVMPVDSGWLEAGYVEGYFEKLETAKGGR